MYRYIKESSSDHHFSAKTTAIESLVGSWTKILEPVVPPPLLCFLFISSCAIMGDETYLESFIEHISTLPHEVRRNLDLMRDLDTSCSVLAEELRQVEQLYAKQCDEKMNQLELGITKDGRPGVKVLTGSGEFVVPTTEDFSEYLYDEDALQKISTLRKDALQQSEEKVAIADQTLALVDATVGRLDRDLQALEALLKQTGEYEISGVAKPNDLAAIQVTPGSSDWILAKVMTHNQETAMYTLSDEDLESNKTFHLPESQVVVLGGIERLSKGDGVYAVYPDTTSFYQASVVQGPRKVAGGGSFIMVNFVDDSDENGITHEKAVLMKHVMRLP